MSLNRQALLVSRELDMSNAKALSAIDKIVKAIEKYGSDIKIVTFVAGETDSYGDVIVAERNDYEDTKGLISNEASESVATAYRGGSNPNTYELSIKLFTKNEINKDNKLIYSGHEHEIVYISSKVLQNTTLLYEVLIKR